MRQQLELWWKYSHLFKTKTSWYLKQQGSCWKTGPWARGKVMSCERCHGIWMIYTASLCLPRTSSPQQVVQPAFSLVLQLQNTTGFSISNIFSLFLDNELWCIRLSPSPHPCTDANKTRSTACAKQGAKFWLTCLVKKQAHSPCSLEYFPLQIQE